MRAEWIIILVVAVVFILFFIADVFAGSTRCYTVDGYQICCYTNSSGNNMDCY